MLAAMPRPTLDLLLPADAPAARRLLAIVPTVFALGFALHVGFDQRVARAGGVS